jgi:hypothetical protein
MGTMDIFVHFYVLVEFILYIHIYYHLVLESYWYLLDEFCTFQGKCVKATPKTLYLVLCLSWFVRMRGIFSKIYVYLYSKAIVKCAHIEGELYQDFTSFSFYHNIYYELKICVLSSNTKNGTLKDKALSLSVFCVC